MTIAAHRFSNALRYRDPEDDRQVQYTPSWLVASIRVVLGGDIGLDPCTTDENPVDAIQYFTPETDGLASGWDNAKTIFVNPPYGRAREPWVEKCIEAAQRGAKAVLLMPAHPDTKCFQHAASHAVDVLFLRGRLKFGVLRENRRQAAASHPSALFGFNVSLRSLSTYGLTMSIVEPPLLLEKR
jgi:phage N-6-adenine-methyltransferase